MNDNEFCLILFHNRKHLAMPAALLPDNSI